MSSAWIIVCESCRSYRTECVSPAGRGPESYLCKACGASFTVPDLEAYVRLNPPDLHRCPKCDMEAVELVEKNHRCPHQPKGENADSYACSHCGQKILVMTQRAPGVLYD